MVRGERADFLVPPRKGREWAASLINCLPPRRCLVAREEFQGRNGSGLEYFHLRGNLAVADAGRCISNQADVAANFSQRYSNRIEQMTDMMNPAG